MKEDQRGDHPEKGKRGQEDIDDIGKHNVLRLVVRFRTRKAIARIAKRLQVYNMLISSRTGALIRSDNRLHIDWRARKPGSSS
ncbi:hypothetical protein GCM10007853_12990 [Algimonas ampicilliniresistens]|uniref:Uncharacterized protein n=1 Tax=Algimonas ampicilliniresistens TaxID=1298735 RepID=A0ABQ5V8P6_9PROT|nr:hypothetical protein GCM10007853_12990 [Algimonas ampicilliniresistens]